MRLRPYIRGADFAPIRRWVRDARTHAMWCADRVPYPLGQGSFEGFLAELAVQSGDCPFVATDDAGRVIGFFCYSLNYERNEGLLKFVVIDPALRGRGLGREMVELAVKYAFEITKANAVRLSVFSENTGAKKCYLGAEFVEETCEEGAFAFGDERWSRCGMIRRKNNSC